jgi:aryl-alcohol dehydrogenase-like predicted oxidoreductase
MTTPQIENGCSASQFVLAWVLHRGADIVPIPGTRRVKYLEKTLGALQIKLSPEDAKRLAYLASPDSIIGDRYTADRMSFLNP